MENSKALFIKAMNEANGIIYADYKNENDFEWELSDEFERKMQSLIKKDNRIKLSTRRRIRKGLLAAVISVIVMMTGVLSISGLRQPFFDIVRRYGDGFNDIEPAEGSGPPPVTSIETEYTIALIPPDYTLAQYQSDEFSVFVVWRDEDNNEICFTQHLLDTYFSIDNEHGYKEFTKNGHTAYYVGDERGSFLLWTDGYYWFNLSVAGELNDELMAMADSLTVKEK